MDEWMSGCVSGWMDREADGRMDGQADGQMERCVNGGWVVARLSAWIKPYLFPTLTVGYYYGRDISDFEVEHVQSLEQLLVCNGGSTHVVSPMFP